MPSIDLPLNAAGEPIISIGVAVSMHKLAALRAANVAAPKPFIGLGLVDTGASGTVIDSAIAKALQLTPTGSVSVHTPTTGKTPQICNCYDVAIWFFSQLPASVQPQIHLLHPSHITLPVMEADFSAQGFHALIGRDILEHCHLSYDGRNKRFSLSYGP